MATKNQIDVEKVRKKATKKVEFLFEGTQSPPLA
jgi:hypothetical protein